MRGDARVEPASVDVVAHKVWRLNHLHAVINRGSNFAANLDLFKRHHHGTDGRFPSVALGKQMTKLRSAKAMSAPMPSDAVW